MKQESTVWPQFGLVDLGVFIAGIGFTYLAVNHSPYIPVVVYPSGVELKFLGYYVAVAGVVLISALGGAVFSHPTLTDVPRTSMRLVATRGALVAVTIAHLGPLRSGTAIITAWTVMATLDIHLIRTWTKCSVGRALLAETISLAVLGLGSALVSIHGLGRYE